MTTRVNLWWKTPPSPKIRRTLACLGATLLASFACGLAAEFRDSDLIPPGDIQGEFGFYGVVFYYAPKPAVPPLETARELAKKMLPDTAFTTDAKDAPTPPFLAFEEEPAPLKNFPFPPPPYFKRAGRGLTDEDISAMQTTSRATCLVFVIPKKDVWTLGRKFTQLAEEFAEKTGAYLWDSATRECFSREAWTKMRLETWPESGIPDITHQITIHLYRPDDSSRYLRAITLGMEKFSLPNVVIERLLPSDNRPAGNLINLVCQSFAEKPVIESGTQEVFRIQDLKAESLRTEMESSLQKGAKKEIMMALLQGQRQEGDAKNRLIELSFENGEGTTEEEKRQDLLGKLWGSHDSIACVTHSDEILAASKRARGKLSALRAAFEKGLPPRSRLLVKAPFPRDDEGKEWMWVEVMTWPANGEIEGILQNDPFHIQKLKVGSKVRIKEVEIFDYILHREDGTKEGNETGKLMEKQDAERKEK